jgi:hypothetical protein
MTTWSLVSTATAISASPNTQLVKVRLALTAVAATAVATPLAWLYVFVPVTGSPLQGNPYFNVPAGWPFTPTLPGP